jgi:hypothetical protein
LLHDEHPHLADARVANASGSPPRSVQVSGFADIGLLTHGVASSDFCASDQRFACGFFQIRSRP